jgi:predicted GIY-YIG superfamily endonuclease
VSECQQLYRLYDKDSRLLYVGISKSALARYAQHAAEKSWIGEVARVHVETYLCTRQEILARELRVIQEERPAYNIAGLPGQKKPRVLAKTAQPLANAKFNATVAVLVAEYLREAEKELRTALGGTSQEFANLVAAARPLLAVLRDRDLGTLTCRDLDAVRTYIAKSGNVYRQQVNALMRDVVEVFRWGCAHGLICGSVWGTLSAFSHWRPGKGDCPEQVPSVKQKHLWELESQLQRRVAASEQCVGSAVDPVVQAIHQTHVASLVAKLRAARDRKRAATGRCEGAKPFGELPGEAEALTALRALARKPVGCDAPTMAEVAEKANAAGIRSRSGRPWTRGTCWNVLRAGKKPEQQSAVEYPCEPSS